MCNFISASINLQTVWDSSSLAEYYSFRNNNHNHPKSGEQCLPIFWVGFTLMILSEFSPKTRWNETSVQFRFRIYGSICKSESSRIWSRPKKTIVISSASPSRLEFLLNQASPKTSQSSLFKIKTIPVPVSNTCVGIRRQPVHIRHIRHSRALTISSAFSSSPDVEDSEVRFTNSLCYFQSIYFGRSLSHVSSLPARLFLTLHSLHPSSPDSRTRVSSKGVDNKLYKCPQGVRQTYSRVRIESEYKTE